MPTEITAAVLRTPKGPFTLERLILDDPRPGEVLVRIVGAGMCHTDLLDRERPESAFLGPIVNGHEGAGIVTAVGEGVTSVVPGDNVVLTFAWCGSCMPCRRQRLAYCQSFRDYNIAGGRPDGSSALRTRDGKVVRSHFFSQSSFASDAIALERNVIKVPKTLPIDVAGPLGCGVQTGAGAILNSLAVTPGSSLVVMGAGSLGLSAIMAGVVAGASPIIAVDRHQSRLAAALKFGATHVLDSTKGNVAKSIQEITRGGADFAFDSTGNERAVKSAWDGLNALGTCGVSGVGWGTLELEMIGLMTGRTLRGIMEGDSVPQQFIPRMAELHAQGKFPFDQIVTKFTLDQINEAEDLCRSGEVIKPVFVFDR